MTALFGVPARSRCTTLAAERAHPASAPPALEPVEAASLAAVLDEIPGAAFVVWTDGAIACANGPGMAAHGHRPDAITSDLRASLAGQGHLFRITPLVTPGAPARFLAVEAGGVTDPAPRIAATVARCRLTPRQGQVLGLLVLGRSNKAIAGELGCAEATVEIHVTALLGKSGCAGRCELVSRFWSESVGAVGTEAAGNVRPRLRSVSLRA